MKKFIKILLLSFAFIIALVPTVKATSEQYFIIGVTPKLVDNADLFTDDEEVIINDLLIQAVEKTQIDVVIVTVNSTEGKSLVAFADDFYDYNGYGIGDDYSGILMLIDMDRRVTYYSTAGQAIDIFTDYGIELLENSVVDSIIDHGYVQGCLTFISEVERYVSEYNSGNVIDIIVEPYEPTEPEEVSLIDTNSIASSLGLGGIGSLFACLRMRSKNKSVGKKTTASNYLRKGSFRLLRQNQWYLYSNVSRTKIQTQRTSSSGHYGGSSTHSSSSGRTHGGGGGRRSF